MSVKISSFELENVKRVRAVALAPSENGLTVIGGRNGQGKTSVLDAIAWALGGEKFRPSGAAREGSVLPPDIRVTLSNGIIVERKGKNSALKVTDPAGGRKGQQLLDAFVEKLALDLPKFMTASDREKAETLLNIIGVGEQLAALDRQEAELYQERLMVGRVADQKQKYAAELPQYEGVPEDLVSASELIRQQQDILARNGENARKRLKRDQIKADVAALDKSIESAAAELERLKRIRRGLDEDIRIAESEAQDLIDESTEELEENIARVDEINAKVRANLDRAKAVEDARQYTAQYNALSVQIDEVRGKKRALLDGAELPLPGLSVEDGALTYKGQAWDCMSGSEQLKVATAIVRRLNPDCGFVLVDKLEQMDPETMKAFGEWLEGEGLQVIATRVSTGEECSIIIEDGMAVAPAATPAANFKEGVF
jgi:predicted ATP-dependent endonuclease of OLD family